MVSETRACRGVVLSGAISLRSLPPGSKRFADVRQRGKGSSSCRCKRLIGASPRCQAPRCAPPASPPSFRPIRRDSASAILLRQRRCPIQRLIRICRLSARLLRARLSFLLASRRLQERLLAISRASNRFSPFYKAWPLAKARAGASFNNNKCSLLSQQACRKTGFFFLERSPQALSG